MGRGLFLFSRSSGNKIAVRPALFKNGPGLPAMQIATLGLRVLLVPIQIEPLQAVENRIERRLCVAIDVGVVDAQNHRAAVTARIQPVKNEGPGASNVQITRRRRGETDTQHEISGYRSQARTHHSAE